MKYKPFAPSLYFRWSWACRRKGLGGEISDLPEPVEGQARCERERTLRRARSIGLPAAQGFRLRCAQLARRQANAVCHSDCDFRKPMDSRTCLGANHSDARRYCCGLRLAVGPNPSLSCFETSASAYQRPAVSVRSLHSDGDVARRGVHVFAFDLTSELGKSAPRATASPAMKSLRSSSSLDIAPSKASLPNSKWCGGWPDATALTMA